MLVVFGAIFIVLAVDVLDRMFPPRQCLKKSFENQLVCVEEGYRMCRRYANRNVEICQEYAP